MEYLREKPVVAGFFIDFVSPSKQTADYGWPDGLQETYPITDNPTIIEHGEWKMKAFRRGSAEEVAMHEILAAHEQRKADLKSDIEADSNKQMAAELAAIDSEEAGTPADQPVADLPVVHPPSNDEVELSECVQEGPHFHCEIDGRSYGCLTDDNQPRHFKSPGAREGHKRSAAHKAEVASVKVAA